MKCWTKYVLPLVIALFVFLGSFFSLYVNAAGAVETEDTDNPYALDNILPLIDGDLYDYNFVCTDSSYVYLFSLTCPSLVALDSSNGYYNVYPSDDGYLFIYKLFDGEWILHNDVHIYGYDSEHRSTLTSASSFYSSNFDIYDVDGNLFFQAPPLLFRVIRLLNLTAVMEEIVMILPLLIAFLVSLIGLRKGLKFILNLLHRA